VSEALEEAGALGLEVVTITGHTLERQLVSLRTLVYHLTHKSKSKVSEEKASCERLTSTIIKPFCTAIHKNPLYTRNDQDFQSLLPLPHYQPN